MVIFIMVNECHSRTQFNYRSEPVFQSSFNLSINKISLPEFYGDGRLILATSKFNLTFNKSLLDELSSVFKCFKKFWD